MQWTNTSCYFGLPLSAPSFEVCFSDTTVVGERTSSCKGWWSCALRQINSNIVWEHLAFLYTACVWQTTQTPGSPIRAHGGKKKSTVALQGHALCRKLSVSVSPSASCSAVKIDQQTWAFFFFNASHFHLDLTRCGGWRSTFLCLTVCQFKVYTRRCLHTLRKVCTLACMSTRIVLSHLFPPHCIQLLI